MNPAENVNSLVLLQGWRASGKRAGALADCTLIVATYKRPAAITTQLDVLAALPDPPAMVIVVDGSPDRRTEEAARAWAGSNHAPFDLTYIASPAGLTRQRNVGLDAAEGDYLFFLDDDCLPKPGYFREIRRVFTEDEAGRVGAVAGCIINGLNRRLPLRWRLRMLLGLVPRGQPGKWYPTATSVPAVTLTEFSGTKAVDMVPGGAAAYRRTVLQRCRFSEFFEGYAQGEDLEMSRRVAREYELRWCGDAHVIHNHASEGRPPRFEHGRMSIRNRYFIWKRHSPGATAPVRFRFWADLLFCISYDFVATAVRPHRRQRLAYVAGAARGIIDCVVAPPRYDEPLPARVYGFQLENLDTVGTARR